MEDQIQTIIDSTQALLNQADTDGLTELVGQLTDSLAKARDLAAAAAETSAAT